MKLTLFWGCLALLMLVPASALAERPTDAPETSESAEVPDAPPEYVRHDGGWIVFIHHPSARERLRTLTAEADELRAVLRKDLGMDVLDHVEVRVAAVAGEMARLSPGERLPTASAVTYSQQRLIVMSLTSPLSSEPLDANHALRHQLAHLALDEATSIPPSKLSRAPAWFQEAYATDIAGSGLARRAQTLSLATIRNDLMSLDELAIASRSEGARRDIAEAQATDLVGFLRETNPDAPFGAMTSELRAGASFDEALEASFGSEQGSAERLWREDLAKRYGFMPIMLGSAVLWLLIATGALVRRQLRQRKQLAADSEPASVPRSTVGPMIEAPPIQVVYRKKKSGGTSRLPRAQTIPPSPDVPKIEHGGQWHTLH